jgi:hypothetical protein
MKSDPNNPHSISAKLRAKRMHLFVSLLEKAGIKNGTLLDIGGTMAFWEIHAKYLPKSTLAGIDILNLPPQAEDIRFIEGIQFRAKAGNALEKSMLEESKYDIVFSNSVIEHVGNLESQKLMAENVKKFGRHYFVQTPAKSFPLEPHFYFPFFAYLPLSMRTWLHQKFNLGFMPRQSDWLQARIDCENTRLLTHREFRSLFSNNLILTERLFGISKAYIATNLGAEEN